MSSSRPNSSLLRFAVVCSSNMNRSMEAHAFLAKKGYNVDSYGTGDKVKLPGPSADRPNVYDFGTSYESIHADLSAKDRDMYTQNGILHMLERNRRVKRAPQRLQEADAVYDVILTAEERVYDQAVDFFEASGGRKGEAVHIVNVDIQDNIDEATIGSFLMGELVQMMAESRDLDDEMENIVLTFEEKCSRPILHTVMFY